MGSAIGGAIDLADAPSVALWVAAVGARHSSFIQVNPYPSMRPSTKGRGRWVFRLFAIKLPTDCAFSLHQAIPSTGRNFFSVPATRHT